MGRHLLLSSGLLSPKGRVLFVRERGATVGIGACDHMSEPIVQVRRLLDVHDHQVWKDQSLSGG